MRPSRLAACLLVFLSYSARAAVPAGERDALVALYEATGGSSWTTRTGWLGAAGTECDWFGVGCDDADATVVSLSLPSNNLSGSLPDKLAGLSNLRYLDLGYNALTGPLGPGITGLANLETLVLSPNALSGALPSTIGSMRKLRALDLGENAFEGAIPDAIGQLSALEELSLDQNRFTAIPAALGSLVNLTALDLAGNQLAGSIPKDLGALVALELLYLQNNGLSGPIPAELRAMVSLRDLDLSYNRLTGSIPPELGQLAQLVEIDLSANLLSGPLPKEIGNLANLRMLGVYSNALEGAIPVELYGLRALEDLWLAGNAFTGTIPDGISALSSLQYVSFEGNQLSGPIPKELGSIASLVSLWLSENQFTGPIPAELMNLRNLRSLSLAGNPLSGPLPPSIGNLTSLEELFVYNTGLTGSLPRELGLLTNLDMLYAGGNHFEGPIPGELATLTNLTALHLGDNRLTGTIPDWIGSFTSLRELVLGNNQLTGPFPAWVTRLTALEGLDLGGNRLTGSIPSDIGNLTNLAYLSLGANFFEGEIPPSLWTLTNLVDLRLDRLDLTGTIPPAIGNLTKLEYLELGDTGLSGTIPPEIGNLEQVQYLALDVNRLSGQIPREIGRLRNLRGIDLSLNALRGPIPPELAQLSALESAGSDFDYNALHTADPALAAFLDSKQYDGNFRDTQTITPTSLRIVSTTDRSLVAEWAPIAFIDGDGGYRLTATPQGGGVSIVATTASKEVGSTIVRGLAAATTYSVTIAAISHPAGGWQKNLVVSDESAAVLATTGEKVTAPADVDLTARAGGLIQIDGKPANEDSFTLTNFGDEPTVLTLEAEGGFFAIEPTSFTLAGGASKPVKVTSIPSAVGGYWGHVAVEGAGVSPEMNVFVTLLSVARPSGAVVAEAVTTRVEITGEPGTDSLGSAQFRNTGTAALSGVVTSDVPWLVPATEQIFIAPGETGAVNFTVARSRRPPGSGDSALTGILTLVYVDGSLSKSAGGMEDFPGALNGTVGVSKTLVTVVDVPKPKVTPSSIPALAAGEVAFFVPGVAARTAAASTLVSDLGIANAYGTKAVDDLAVYYLRLGGSQASKAAIGAIGADVSLTLANVIPNVYGATSTETGTLQLRSGALESLVVTGRLLELAKSGGALLGEVPVLRSDHAAPSSERIILTGVGGAGTSTEVFVQETSGAGGAARVTMLDASGTVLVTNDVTLQPFGTASVSGAPAGAITAVVMNSGASGRIVAYARVTDTASGDSWSVVDWGRRQQRVVRTASLRLPFAASSSAGGGGRRRLVRRSSTGPASADASSPATATELWVHNPGSTDALVELALIDAAGGRRELDVTIAAGATRHWSDVVSSIAGASASGSLELAPRLGAIAATARLRIAAACGSCGAVLPIVPSGAGLRRGQLQRFAGIDGASAATIDASKPGTFRSAFGIVETSGSPVTVRATLKLADGRSPVAAVLMRLVALGGGGAARFDDLATALFGDARGDADLHGLQVDFEVVDGSGSAVVWVTSTDNATGDAIVRIE